MLRVELACFAGMNGLIRYEIRAQCNLHLVTLTSSDLTS